jgi:septum site-determining protein MinC
MNSVSVSPPPIQIKGLRDGLLVSMGDAAWKDLETALLAQIDERQKFFEGARLAIEVGKQELHVAELSALRDQLSERGLTLWAVISNSSATEKTAQLLGLATQISKPRPNALRGAVIENAEETALWVKRTLRSGTRIEFAGHVVVLGDVNPGAEIVAAGSVLVWGRLRGVVHAGAVGDKEAVVCALDLSPTQLRIADGIAVPPKKKKTKKKIPQPEIAYLQDGQLVADPWQPG